MIDITTLIVICVLILIIFVLIIYIYLLKSRGLCKFSGHLINKVVIVTGANTGIGFEVAKNLAERGARVILACRSETKAMKAVIDIKNLTHNENIYYRHLNLASLTSVKEFAANILNTEERLDIFINNAGIITGSDEKTEDGFSVMMQTNYLAPFLLTVLLLPLLKSSGPSRIINLSSITHKFVNMNPDHLSTVPMKRKFANSVWYFRTKLCMVLMTMELARRLKNTSVTVNCLHPGAINTEMVNNIDIKSIKILINAMLFCFKNPWEGAQTTIYLAVAPEMENKSGGYYVDCKLAMPSRLAQDPDLGLKLWEVSEKLLDL